MKIHDGGCHRLTFSQFPVDVDVDCVDIELIARLQHQQRVGDTQSLAATTMSSTLSQLDIYRLKSRIMSVDLLGENDI